MSVYDTSSIPHNVVQVLTSRVSNRNLSYKVFRVHNMNKNVKFIVYSAGIFFCYFVYAILQEKLLRGSYGDGEKFTCTLSLVLVQCFGNYLFAKGFIRFLGKEEIDKTPTEYYFSSALTYLLGMVCSNMALQWVNYPTQVIAKSAKPIPVMVLGVLIGRKNYPLKKYLFILLIVVGVIIFMMKDKAGVEEKSTTGIGELLLVLSLTMDGLTGAVQDRMRGESQPSAPSMMLNTNFWSVILSGVGVLLSREIFTFIAFAGRYPELLWYMFWFSITAALGQIFIFLMIFEFGPLTCSVVTTTRKFFTVLASVIIFGNVLLARQWGGAMLVFAGLFLDTFYGKTAKPKPEISN